MGTTDSKNKEKADVDEKMDSLERGVGPDITRRSTMHTISMSTCTVAAAWGYDPDDTLILNMNFPALILLLIL